jgi:hypothetical protein
MAESKPVPSNVAAAFYQKGYPQPRMLPQVGAPPSPFPPYANWRRPGMYTRYSTARMTPPMLPQVGQQFAPS